MGILGEIAYRMMAPQVKKKFEEVAEIIKDDPELQKALMDLKNYKERLEEIQYVLLEHNKDHPDYDPLVQEKRRKNIERREKDEKSQKNDLFDLAVNYNLFCDKSYWLKQDLKDLVRIVEYLKKVGPLEIEGLKEFFEECVNRNNVGKLIISRDNLKTNKEIKNSFFKSLFTELDYKTLAKNFIEENINFKDVQIFLFPYFIFTNKRFYTYSAPVGNPIPKWRELNYFDFIGSISFKKDDILEFKSSSGKNFFSNLLTRQHMEFNVKSKKYNWILESSTQASLSLGLFEKIQPDLKEFLDHYKKEQSKVAPKLLVEIKKCIKNN